jgi:hypothetical protein
MESDDARPPDNVRPEDEGLPAIPLQDLLGLGAESEPSPPGPDDLRAIVARADRRRLRVTAAGVVAALAVGAGIGYGVSNHGSGALQTASSSSSTSLPTANGPTVNGQTGNGSSASGAASSGGVATAPAPEGLPAVGYSTLTSLFHRTTKGITIRGFLSEFAPPPVGLLPRCTLYPLGSTFRGEVSTAKMVGLVDGGVSWTASSSSVETVDAQVLGVAEGDPTAVVTVGTSSAVARVHMAFAGGGSDEMVPVRGWAALAAPAPALAGAAMSGAVNSKVGVLTAYNAAGHTLSTSSVTLGYFTPGPLPTPPLPSPLCGICPRATVAPPAPAGNGVYPGAPMIPQTTVPQKAPTKLKAPANLHATSLPGFACPGVRGGTSGGGSGSSGGSAGPPTTGKSSAGGSTGSSGTATTVSGGAATG